MDVEGALCMLIKNWHFKIIAFLLKQLKLTLRTALFMEITGRIRYFINSVISDIGFFLEKQISITILYYRL